MQFVVIGAGGQARETQWLIESLGHWCLGFVVTEPSKLTDRDSPILGGYEWLLANTSKYEALALGIGMPPHRAKVGMELKSMLPNVQWPPLVDPSVRIGHGCALHEGTMVAAGSVLTVGVQLKAWSMINTNVSLGHEVTVGEGSVVHPQASLGGGVVLEDNVMIGSGANVLQYLKVGAGARVGTGAVVTHAVTPHTTVVGIPAKMIDAGRQGNQTP